MGCAYLHRPGDSNEIAPSTLLDTPKPTSGPRPLEVRPTRASQQYDIDMDSKLSSHWRPPLGQTVDRNHLSRHNPDTELRYLRENNDRLLARLMDSIKSIDRNSSVDNSARSQVTADRLPRPAVSKRTVRRTVIRDWRRSPWSRDNFFGRFYVRRSSLGGL